MTELDVAKINQFVLKKQRLADQNPCEGLVETIRATGGLHATIAATPYLSLFARIKDFRREQLDYELYVSRNLGKIRYVRTTVYVLPKDTIPTALIALRTLNELSSQNYASFLGISKEQYNELSRQIMKAVEGKNGMTTKHIKQQLQTEVNVSPIVNLMCDQGILIRGGPQKGWKSNLHTYYLLKEYFPDLEWNSINEKDARIKVVRHYLASFGPVTEKDILWWTGFNKGQLKPIIEELENEVIRVTVSGIDKEFIMLSHDKKALMATQAKKEHIVNLLPALDPYLMGYKDREKYLDSNYYDYVYDRSGNAVASILLDGKMVGVWDFEKPSFVKIFLFEGVQAEVLREVKSRAKSMGFFILGKEPELVECSSMIPLSQRTAGGFMSPLRGS